MSPTRRSFAILVVACAPAWGGCLLVRHVDDLSGGKSHVDAGVADGSSGDDDDAGNTGVPVVIASGRSTPTAIVAAGGVAYWAEDNAIMSAAPGNDPSPVVSLDITPTSVSVDVTTGRLSWTSPGQSGVVGQCTIGGGCSLKNGKATPDDSIVAMNIDTATSPSGTVADDTNYFWTQGDNGGSLVLCEASPCDNTSAQVLADHLSRPRGISSNGGTFVYWVNAGDPGASNGTVMRIDKDADNNGDRQTMMIARDQASPSQIADYGDFVYWTNTEKGGSIESVKNDGSSAQTIATGQANVRGIAAGNSGVYWTTYSDSGEVLTCPLTGCGADAPHVIASGQARAFGVAVDPANVYWTVKDAVMKIAKPH